MNWVERITLRWYGHIRTMPEERMAKRVYQSTVHGMVGRARPHMSWQGKVEHYLKDSEWGTKWDRKDKDSL